MNLGLLKRHEQLNDSELLKKDFVVVVFMIQCDLFGTDSAMHKSCNMTSAGCHSLLSCDSEIIISKLLIATCMGTS